MFNKIIRIENENYGNEVWYKLYENMNETEIHQ